jgi:hypothetical protein
LPTQGLSPETPIADANMSAAFKTRKDYMQKRRDLLNICAADALNQQWAWRAAINRGGVTPPPILSGFNACIALRTDARAPPAKVHRENPREKY